MLKSGLTPNQPSTPESESELLSHLEHHLRTDPFLPKRDTGTEETVGVQPMTAAEEQIWEEREELSIEKIKRHKAFMLAWKVLAGIVIIVVFVLGVISWQRSAFSPDRVTVAVDAPTAVDAAQDVEFTVSYANNNRANLDNAELDLYYPSGFVVSRMAPNMVVDGAMIRMKVGTLAGHGADKVTLVGKFFGSRESLSYLKAVLRYTPSNLSSVFEASSQASVALRSSSLAIDIDTPLEIASGSMVEYLVTATNTSDTAISNMRLQMTPPEGFVQSDASPQPSEGERIWYIGTIEPHQKLTFRISGTLSGSNGEMKNLTADFGVVQGNGNFLSFATATRATKLVPSPLVIFQTVNGATKLNAHPGDRLRYVLNYQNQSSAPLRNLIVTFEIHSELFDLTQMQLDSGSYDAQHRTITWKASDDPRLASLNPGEGGSIKFSIPLYASWDPTSANANNQAVVTVAKIDSPDVPTPLGSNKVIASNRLTLPVASVPRIAVAVSPVSDAVPANPSDRQFVIRLLVTNTSNAIKDAQVKVSLAPNVHWLKSLETGNEHLVFSDRTNEVEWDLGGVEVNAGSTNPTRGASFQVVFTPAPNQVQSIGQNLLLNDKSLVLTATDTLTQEPVNVVYQQSVKVSNAQ